MHTVLFDSDSIFLYNQAKLKCKVKLRQGKCISSDIYIQRTIFEGPSLSKCSYTSTCDLYQSLAFNDGLLGQGSSLGGPLQNYQKECLSVPNYGHHGNKKNPLESFLSHNFYS